VTDDLEKPLAELLTDLFEGFLLLGGELLSLGTVAKAVAVDIALNDSARTMVMRDKTPEGAF